MKSIYSFLILFSFLAQARVPTDPYRSLSRVDYQIYLSTLKKCSDNFGAVRLSADFNLLKSGVMNWLKISALDPAASRERYQSGFLSPEISRLRRSDGFWLALAHCYPERDKLVKQLIDVGHLFTEVVALGGVVTGALQMGQVTGRLVVTYPLASRFALSGLALLSAQNLIGTIKEEYFSELSAEARQQLTDIEKKLFQDVDAEIEATVRLAEQILVDINERLEQPDLQSEQRDLLLAKRQRILQSLKGLLLIKNGADQ